MIPSFIIPPSELSRISLYPVPQLQDGPEPTEDEIEYAIMELHQTFLTRSNDAFSEKIRAKADSISAHLEKMQQQGNSPREIFRYVKDSTAQMQSAKKAFDESKISSEEKAESFTTQCNKLREKLNPSRLSFAPLFPTSSPQQRAHLSPDEEVISNIPGIGENRKKCEENISLVIKEIQQCPRAKKLWDDVSGAGKFSIAVVSSDDAPAGAHVKPRSRAIEISSSNENDINRIRHLLVFELNNLKRAEALKKILSDCCRYSDETIYAREIEKVEYSSRQETNEVLNACRENGMWPDVEPINFGSFEEYFARAQHTGHSGYYRLEWLKQCKHITQISDLK